MAELIEMLFGMSSCRLGWVQGSTC